MPSAARFLMAVCALRQAFPQRNLQLDRLRSSVRGQLWDRSEVHSVVGLFNLSGHERPRFGQLDTQQMLRTATFGTAAASPR